MTAINYTNFDNPRGLCLVAGAHHVGGSGSVSGKIRLVNFIDNNSLTYGAMWSTTRFNVIAGFNTTYTYRVDGRTIDSLNFVIQNNNDGLRAYPGNYLGMIDQRAVHIMLDVNDTPGGSSTPAEAKLYYYSEHTPQTLFTKSLNSPALPVLPTDNQLHTVNIRYEPSVSDRIIVTVNDTYEYYYVPPAGFLDFTTANAAQGRFAGAYLGFTAGSYGQAFSSVTVDSWTHTGTPLPARTPTSIPAANCTSLNPDTPGLYNPLNSAWLLRSTTTPASGGADFSYVWNPNPTANSAPVALIGDWDGDGIDTPGLFDRDSSYRFRFRLSNQQDGGGPVNTFTVDTHRVGYAQNDHNLVQPIVGDWDGDGADTVGLAYLHFVYIDNTQIDESRLFRMLRSNTTNPPEDRVIFGARKQEALPLAYAVSGDWNGDGKDTVGWYYPKSYPAPLYNTAPTRTAYPNHAAVSDSMFRLTNLDGYPELVIRYGQNGDLGSLRPIVGNWSSNTCQQLIGLYNPANGAWLLRDANIAGSVSRSFPYGPGNYAVTSTATQGSSPTLILQPLAGKYAGTRTPTPISCGGAAGGFKPSNTCNQITATPFPTFPPATATPTRSNTPTPTRTASSTLTATATATPLATIRLPMDNGKLTNCDFEARAAGGIPSRDINPPGLPASNPAYAPVASSEVMIVDDDVDNDGNAGLGKFVAIRVDSDSLPNLSAVMCRRSGYFYIGYAHLSSTNGLVPNRNSPFTLVPSNLQVGTSGSSGTNNIHLDLTVFWVPKVNANNVRPEPNTTGRGSNDFQAFYVLGTQAQYEPVVVDPREIWPQISQGTSCDATPVIAQCPPGTPRPTWTPTLTPTP